MNECIEKEGLPREPEDLHDLRVKRLEIVASVVHYRVGFYLAIAVGWLVPFAFYAYVATQSNLEPLKILPGIVGFVVVAISFTAFFNTQRRALESELQDIDFEIELQKFEVLSRERRAEKIVRMSNVQLRRYYYLNLNQNIWVFGIGVCCIAVGVGIIGAAFYFILKVPDSEANIIIAGLGAVGAILVNFVAAVFLKIHGVATGNLSSFHSRLVETNQLLMGNLLASRIEDDKTRWQTLSKLALHVTERGLHKDTEHEK